MLGKTNAQVKIGGVDTSDATATSNDILLGKTAYANDEKIVGTIPTYNNEHENGYVQVNTLKNLLDATKSTSYLFKNYTGTSVDDLIQPNDTENVTNMDYMFNECSNLTTIPLLNTSNVTNMSNMLYRCTELATIPQLNTSNVINMNSMFYFCMNLITIPQLDTSSVTNMASMFYFCSNLTTIPQLDTSKVTSMSFMFYNCLNLSTIPQLDASNVTSMTNIFGSCKSLKSILMYGMKVSFDISASTQFTDNDLQIIIDNLATVTSTQTLTMGATNLAKVKDAYVEKATNKGWTLA